MGADLEKKRPTLLLSDRPEDMEFVSTVASIAGLSVIKAKDALEAADIINAEEPSNIFVDCSDQVHYTVFENAVQDKVGLFSDKISENAVHFLSSKNLEEVPYLINSPLFGHFILRNA